MPKIINQNKKLAEQNSTVLHFDELNEMPTEAASVQIVSPLNRNGQSMNLVVSEIEAFRTAMKEQEDFALKQSLRKKDIRINELALELIEIKKQLLFTQLDAARLNARVKELEMIDQSKVLTEQNQTIKTEMSAPRVGPFKSVTSAIKLRMGLPENEDIDIDTESWTVV